ncbi:formate dehydrogenase subunit gamma [Rhizobium rhizosphaerae]|uniref:Formate dehydrogenase subunit gamma n=1 Tax=Xaviernesmea rhizosphaerae TaxID=1672749 RepID=A0A1Q9ALM0_9HYPH|nr:formate dehydrogenase subunit gamma [Xaviernesmea rhizosphaerae]OLP56190.1 formate dehydrogenase subunit gamma [Xaviernesmea rhizosphaerae]OQP86992.1 formate dehydrogenase subunit gamma [Xaviernesmea rhizosphaerae]
MTLHTLAPEEADRIPASAKERILEIVADCRGLEGPLLPILHAVQHEFGYIPEGAKPIIATALNLSRAEVHGTVTFYPDFRDRPAGQHVLKLCRAEACQAMGAHALGDKARALLGVDWHETTADGRVTLEPVFCLGLCACGPAAMLDGELLARLDEESLAEHLTEIRL